MGLQGEKFAIFLKGLLRNTKLCRTENRYFDGLSK